MISADTAARSPWRSLALGVARAGGAIAVAEIGRLAVAFHAGGNRTEMHGRLAVDALVGVAAAIDADIESGRFKCPVADPFPGLPDDFDLARAGREIVELAGLGAESVGAEPARRHQKMRVIIPRVAMPIGRMDREVDSDAVAVDERCGKLPHSVEPLISR